MTGNGLITEMAALKDMLSDSVGEIRALKTRVADLERKEVEVFGVRARVYNSSDITVPTGVWTPLTYDSERWDTDGMHSTVSNTDRLTIQRSGWYVITGNVRFAANASGYRGLLFYRNTTVIGYKLLPNVGNASIHTTFDLTTQYYFDVGDYIILSAYQSSGLDLDVLSIANFSPELMVVRAP